MAPHIYIVGQTASGKSQLALELAEEQGYEILNTDSLLFYKDLNIGTAKPTQKELSMVPHHMVNLCEVGGLLSAADYADQAKETLKVSSKALLCVGGSGFYINALDVGLLPLPHTDPKVVERVHKIENPAGELKKVDPDFFRSVSENDLYRVKRALQVFFQTGKPLSQWKKGFQPRPLAKKVALHFERGDLLKRVKLRTKKMVQKGLIDEVKTLLKKHPDAKSWKPLRSVGYMQVLDYLDGLIGSLEEFENQVVTKTMQLSKRQKTWFKKDTSVKWFDAQDVQKAKDYILKSFKEQKWKA